MPRTDHDLTIERFDYARVGDEWAVLRVLSRMAADLGVPPHAQLLVRGDQPVRAYPARACRSERRLLPGGGSELLWRALFAVPIEVVEQPDSLFALSADGRLALALPAPDARACLPGTLTLAKPVVTYDSSRLAIAQIRVRAAAVATAVLVSATSTPAVALAAGGLGHKQHAVTRHASIHKADAATLSKPVSSTHQHRSSTQKPSSTSHKPGKPSSKPTGHGAAHHAHHNGKASDQTHKAVTHLFTARRHRLHVHLGTPGCTPMATAASGPPAKAKHSPSCAKPHEYTAAVPGGTHRKAAGKRAHPGRGSNGTTTPTAPSAGAAPPTGPTTAPQPPSSPTTGPTNTPTTGPTNTPTTGPTNTPVAAPTVTGGRGQRRSHRVGSHRGSTTAKHARAHKRGKRPPSSTTTGGAAPTLPQTPAPGFFGPTSWTGVVNADPGLTGALGNLAQQFDYGDTPPEFLIPIYMEAGKRYGVPWEVLAAINAVESDYGRDLSTSSAGAIGWMQFEPSTWKEYGVAADGHSVANPYDPRDAIFSAARYLAAAGAGQNISQAIFAYNHAPWYVEMVLSRARAIAANVQFERQTIKHGVLSVFFSTGQIKHPTARYKGGLLSHYDRLIAAANMVSAADFPYLYGGGHEQPARFGPFDCSGSVSYVLQQAGYKVPTTVSGEVPVWKFPSGPGRVTIFYNAGHTFMRIGNRYFGTSGFARPGGGAGWFDVGRLPVGYLSTFNEVHVPRLGTNSFAPPKRAIRPGS